MIKYFPIIICCFFLTTLHGQSVTQKYWIQFTDKDNNSFSIDHPEDFLSPKAIEKRARHNIPIKPNDLPVSGAYLESLRTLELTILHTSKWFNAATIAFEDSSILDSILHLSFVKNLEQVKKVSGKKSVRQDKLEDESTFPAPEINGEEYYGAGYNQISMLNGDFLHSKGLTGKNMTIAVMDAGFAAVPFMDAFAHLGFNNRIKGTFDFVTQNKDVYDFSTHGTSVLSVMASNIPGTMVGTAPDADYFLFRTEDGSSERLIEEDNWVVAAERADSLGVDVINTSLGYSIFDVPSMNHSYNDMDGNSTRISIAADIAASKGIIVVSSAGNEGNSSWFYITAPADGDSVLSIGAVDENRNVASFSSHGPSSDGDVKPNICAQGANTSIVLTNNSVVSGSGTSFASPVITGLAACLWQAFPQRSNMEIFHAIQQSANQFADPNSECGYGIPDFNRAYALLAAERETILQEDEEILIYPNPFINELNIFFHAKSDEFYSVQVFNSLGAEMANETLNLSEGLFDKVVLDKRVFPQTGVYIIRIITSDETIDSKVVKVR